MKTGLSKSQNKTFFQKLISSTFNSITIISIITPVFILKLGYLPFRDLIIKFPLDSNFEQFIFILNNNEWVDAFIDMIIQFSVLIISFCITLFISIKFLRKIHLFSIIEDSKFNRLLTINKLVILFVLIAGLCAIFSGILISPQQLEIFKLNSENRSTFYGIHFPPLNSLLFIFRVAISFFGIYITYISNYSFLKLSE